MANFLETANKALSIIQSHELYKPSHTEEWLNNWIERTAETEKWSTADPFVIIVGNVEPIAIYRIDGYDDCNTYQEEGYYKNALEEYEKISNGDITLSDISEKWDESGRVKVTFKYNGQSRELDFDIVNGEVDMVPEKFTLFQEELMNGLVEKNKCIEILGEGGFSYYFLPEELCSQLNQVKKNFVPTLSWD